MKQLFFALVAFAASVAWAGEIRGRITDSESGAPLPGVNLVIVGTNLRAASDIKGNFVLAPITERIVLLQTSYLGYKTLVDTIQIRKDSLIVMDYQLVKDRIPLKTFPEYEAYHKDLQKEPKVISIVDVRIEKRKTSKEMYVEFKVKNNTKLPISIARPGDCWHHFQPIIYDSIGEKMQPNIVASLCDCMPNRLYPDSTDLITIPMEAAIKYPPIWFFPYAISELTKGSYTVQVKYYFEQPKSITRQWDTRKDLSQSITVLNLLLRGEYLSENSATFEK